METSELALMVTACVVLILAYAGWRSRKKHHTPVVGDPGLIFLAAAFLITAAVMATADVTICALAGIGAYALGHYIGPAERRILVWTRDPKTHENYIETIKYYIEDKEAFVAPLTIERSFASLFGVRDKLDIDLTRPYYMTAITVDGEKYENIIPIAHAPEPVMTKQGRIRIGSKKATDAEGNEIKEPRYLLCFEQQTVKYNPADRTYQRPDQVYFDLAVLDKAIADSSMARAQVTRLEQELATAKYDGVVDHVRDMCSLDVDHHNLPVTLEELVVAEEKRRLAAAGVEDDGEGEK